MSYLLNTIVIFTSNSNTCSIEKNIKFNKFKEEQNELKTTQVTEKTHTDSSGV